MRKNKGWSDDFKNYYELYENRRRYAIRWPRPGRLNNWITNITNRIISATRNTATEHRSK